MQTREYEGTVDYFLFKVDTAKVDLNVIKIYTGNTPFIIGNVVLEQLDKLKAFQHPMFVGVDLDDCADVQASIKALTE